MGRPNVGKSSLLNKLAKENRAVVDSVAGTTRDPVDELIELGGKTWRFIDTAGIRKRHRQNQGADFYAILRTQSALERSEVAVVLVDDPARRTMAGALGAFQGQWGTDVPLLCAGSLLILTPTLIVFLAFQRKFVSALMQGALKG